MSVGLDVGLNCKQCTVLLASTPQRRYRYKRFGKLFCSKSCSTSYKNITNNPMKNNSTRKKLSETCKKQRKWQGNNNPNNNGKNTLQFWAAGVYDLRDLAGEKNPAWIDGRSFINNKYGKDWRINRLKVLKRDNYKCIICLSEKDLVVHHKIPFALSKSNDTEILQTLCRKCHGTTHMTIGWNYFSRRSS